ncbi:hypothetical protein M404DRAFT_1004423 [Pisolithus tinctorius Marx 270]|uniref:Uncharacterized protein n=1 Tax=Pisolithus tinctorius Marx 270 TaxID=870435 RepID=A0A0C3IS11_PISTI|nr:hypothetical protein M404DRAFT_1004423 [Pisolithus tinctorius Marx 270]
MHQQRREKWETITATSGMERLDCTDDTKNAPCGEKIFVDLGRKRVRTKAVHFGRA